MYISKEMWLNMEREKERNNRENWRENWRECWIEKTGKVEMIKKENGEVIGAKKAEKKPQIEIGRALENGSESLIG